MGKIFVALTEGEPGDFLVDVVAEDGTPLAEGACRSALAVYLAHRLPEIKAEAHSYYPEGYELIVVPPNETATHPGFHAALGRYFARGLDG